MRLDANGQFVSGDKPLSVFAKQNRAGRWQFRMESHKGKLIASGMTPAQFAKSFWYRDDFVA